MIDRLKNTSNFRKIAIILVLLVVLDGVSTFLALSLGYREGNPIVNALGGPWSSILIRLALIYTAMVRSYTWDRPNRILIIAISYIFAVLVHALVVANNFYLSFLRL